MTIRIFVILFFIILTIFANISHQTELRNNFVSGRIKNLNNYLDFFTSCLVHIINYDGVNLKNLNNPIVLSHYPTTAVDRDLNTRNTYRRSRYWEDKCLVQLYLYPTDSNNEVKFHLPFQYFNFWSYYYDYYNDQGTGRRKAYHILV